MAQKKNAKAPALVTPTPPDDEQTLVQELRERINELQTTVKEKDKEIFDLNLTINKLKASIVSYKSANTKLQKANAAFAEELQKVKDEYDKLLEQQAHADSKPWYKKLKSLFG